LKLSGPSYQNLVSCSISEAGAELDLLSISEAEAELDLLSISEGAEAKLDLLSISEADLMSPGCLVIHIVVGDRLPLLVVGEHLPLSSGEHSPTTPLQPQPDHALMISS
jgi:hypothetical protein